MATRWGTKTFHKAEFTVDTNHHEYLIGVLCWFLWWCAFQVFSVSQICCAVCLKVCHLPKSLRQKWNPQTLLTKVCSSFTQQLSETVEGGGGNLYIISFASFQFLPKHLQYSGTIKTLFFIDVFIFFHVRILKDRSLIQGKIKFWQRKKQAFFTSTNLALVTNLRNK